MCIAHNTLLKNVEPRLDRGPRFPSPPSRLELDDTALGLVIYRYPIDVEPGRQAFARIVREVPGHGVPAGARALLFLELADVFPEPIPNIYREAARALRHCVDDVKRAGDTHGLIRIQELRGSLKRGRSTLYRGGRVLI